MPTNKELARILRYCYNISMLVSPNTAQQFGLNKFDGAVCDFLKDLSVSLENEQPFDLHGDEFYAEIYERINSSNI